MKFKQFNNGHNIQTNVYDDNDELYNGFYKCKYTDGNVLVQDGRKYHGFYKGNTQEIIIYSWEVDKRVCEFNKENVIRLDDEGFIFYSNGLPYNGITYIDNRDYSYKDGKLNKESFVYKGQIFEDGVTINGIHSDGLYYDRGILLSGSKCGVHYLDGKLIDGFHEFKLYENGNLYCGLHEDKLYKYGRLDSGLYEGILYENGEPYTGYITGYYYVDGKECNGWFDYRIKKWRR